MTAAAGEHLVCADLLMQGFRAIMASQMCPYDVAVDIDGRLARLQVKTTRVPRRLVGGNAAYQWSVTRAGRRREAYTVEHCELVALVALDIRRVAYFDVADVASTQLIYATGPNAQPDFAEFSFQWATRRCS